jgi:hypothetical protein
MLLSVRGRNSATLKNVMSATRTEQLQALRSPRIASILLCAMYLIVRYLRRCKLSTLLCAICSCRVLPISSCALSISCAIHRSHKPMAQQAVLATTTPSWLRDLSRRMAVEKARMCVDLEEYIALALVQALLPISNRHR